MPGHDVTASASGNSKLTFGLATFPSSTQTYPVISTNGSTTWKIDGPLFHVDALQGANAVASSGVLPHAAPSFGYTGATSYGLPTTTALTGGLLSSAPESRI